MVDGISGARGWDFILCCSFSMDGRISHFHIDGWKNLHKEGICLDSFLFFYDQ